MWRLISLKYLFQNPAEAARAGAGQRRPGGKIPAYDPTAPRKARANLGARPFDGSRRVWQSSAFIVAGDSDEILFTL